MLLNLKSFTLGLSLLCFFLIVLSPIGYMFIQSFFVDGKFTLSTYGIIGYRQFRLLKNSLLLGMGTTTLAMLMGVPMAFLVTRTDMPFRGLFRLSCVLPLIIPPYIGAISWIHLLGRAGIINGALMELFSLSEPPLLIYGLFGSVMVLSLFTFPYVMLLASISLQSIDPRLEEAGHMCYSKLKTLKKITLPLTAPAILSGGLFVFIYAISDFGVVSFLNYNTFTVEIYSQFSAFYNFKTATASSIVLVLVALILLGLQRRWTGKRSFVTISSAFREPDMIKLGNYNYIALLFCSTVIFLSVLLPLGILLQQSIYSTTLIPLIEMESYNPDQKRQGEISLKNYSLVVSEGKTQILNSLTFAVSGATIAVILGLFLSYITERIRSAGALDILYVIPYAIPGTIIGLGLIMLWNRPGFFVYGTPLIILFGYLTRFMPFAIKSITPAIKQIDPSLEEAASVSGVSWFSNLTKIIVPLVKQGMVVGWIIVFISSMAELNTTIMVYPPGYSTLPLSIFTLHHDGPPGLVAALSIVLIALTVMPVLLFYIITRKFYIIGRMLIPD